MERLWFCTMGLACKSASACGTALFRTRLLAGDHAQRSDDVPRRGSIERRAALDVRSIARCAPEPKSWLVARVIAEHRSRQTWIRDQVAKRHCYRVPRRREMEPSHLRTGHVLLRGSNLEKLEC
jgi:hypothetical protein